MITVLCSQPAGDPSHKPGCRLTLLSARITHYNELVFASSDGLSDNYSYIVLRALGKLPVRVYR